MPRRVADNRPVDWDAALTLSLTIGVLALSLGSAALPALRRVLRAARTMVEGRPDPVGWLLVPGKRLANGMPDRDFAARLRAAADLATDQQACAILILGGVTAAASISEAAAGEHFLRSLPGGASLVILRESESQDTLTNLRNARELLGGRMAGVPVTLVSNRYHVARIGLMATSLGIDHRVWPAEPTFAPDSAMWSRLLSESFYCLWFDVGKGWARLTRNRRMLERVS